MLQHRSLCRRAVELALAVAALAVVPALGVRAASAAPELDDRLSRMVGRALPAVVSITTRAIEQDQFNQQVVRPGLGSGFIVDRRGYVLTNHHVVAGASEIKVGLADGRNFRAVLVGDDAFTDLAVLKVEGERLPTLPLGDSRRLRIAETLVAIGNPLWLEGGATVTVGVVSGLGRSMEQEGLPVLHGMIQTDAAINHGNSGGPLLNLEGRVVGVNTAIVPSAHGIGFAIAIDSVKPLLQTLMAGGRIVRPTLGVVAVSLTPQVAWVNGLAIEHGVLVRRVPDSSPAARAGLAAGDVVTALGRDPIHGLHDLHEALLRRKAGDQVDVTVWRDGATKRLRVQLGVEP